MATMVGMGWTPKWFPRKEENWPLEKANPPASSTGAGLYKDGVDVSGQSKMARQGRPKDMSAVTVKQYLGGQDQRREDPSSRLPAVPPPAV